MCKWTAPDTDRLVAGGLRWACVSRRPVLRGQIPLGLVKGCTRSVDLDGVLRDIDVF